MNKTVLTSFTILCLLSTASLTGIKISVKANPDIIYVPTDYPTIQEAINAANEGDTIFVYNGTYNENLVVNKTLTVIGENQSTTVIDGGGKGKVVIIRANYVVFSGFTVRHSGNWTSWVDYYTPPDTGILLFKTVACNISNNLVKDNKGGIIFVESLHNSLKNNVISGNKYNFGLYGEWNVSSWFNDIDSSNTVEGKPIYYLVNKHDVQVPVNAGYLALVNCSDITVENLTITRNYQGVALVASSNITLKNLKSVGNDRGIFLSDTENSTIEKIEVSRNNIGVDLLRSNHIRISDNKIEHNNSTGISISSSMSNVLYRNTLVDNNYNLAITGYFNHKINTSNTVNGKPVYYLMNQRNLRINPSTFPQIGYLALINSSNIIIENLTQTSNYQGVLLYNTHNSIMRNLRSFNNYEGVKMANCDNVTVTNSDISENEMGGIKFAVSHNCKVVQSYIFYNGVCGVGIHGDNNSVIGNNIIGNGWRGITLEGDHNVISHNNFIYNVALRLYESNGNNIHHNNFFNEYPVDIFKPGQNRWDYNGEGNFWIDYDGTDIDQDGIGDQPYIIDENNKDHYPLMRPYPELLFNFTALQKAYINMIIAHNDLFDHFSSLNSTYYNLLVNYNNLESTLEDLQSKHEATMNELNNIRNLMYIFIATTIVLIATTVYFAIRKPKLIPKTKTKKKG